MIRRVFLAGSLLSVVHCARPLGDYPSEPAPTGSRAGLRRYRHSEAHRLSDGGDVALAWEVDANPDELLSLDLTHADGAQIVECSRSRLKVWLPERHTKTLSSWRHIVASDGLHGCSHLRKWEHLYHKILGFEEVIQKSEGSLVTVKTQELEQPTRMFSHVRVFFRYMPVEAKDPDAQPRQGPIGTRKLLADDRLAYPFTQSLPGTPSVVEASATDVAAPKPSPRPPTPSHAHTMLDGLLGALETNALHVESDFEQTDSDVNSIFNLDAPQSISNIGWNWDYDTKTERNPEFVFHYPGGEGWLRLHKPHLKAHLGLTVNFTSEMADILQTPQVHIVADVAGFADLNADIATAINFDQDEKIRVSDQNGAGPFDVFSLLGHEKHDFKPFKVDIGGTPVNIQPAFTCHINAYHFGKLKGSLRVGLKTKLLIDGRLTFDTISGLDTNFNVKALDVTVTPPTWMLFTERFELGMELAPEMWLNGGLGPMKDMEFGMGLRPYMNVSIMRKGQENALSGSSMHSFGDMNELVVFPFRVSGLPGGMSSYAVRVTINGKSRTTSFQICLAGVVEYSDLLRNFVFGSMAENDVIGKEIVVDLLRDGEELPIATGITHCQGLANGECAPAPMVASLSVHGKPVYIHLSSAWQASPLLYLMEKMRGVSYAIPQIILAKDLSNRLSSERHPNAKWRLRRNGRNYELPLRVGKTKDKRLLLTSFEIYDLGRRFLDGWKPASAPRSAQAEAPLVELVVDDEVVGVGRLPTVNWQKPLASLTLSKLFDEGNLIPLDIALTDPNRGRIPAGEGKMQMLFTGAASSAYWIYPYEADEFIAGKTKTLYWTLPMQSSRYASLAAKPVAFTIGAFQVSDSGQLVRTRWNHSVFAKCDRKDDVEVRSYMDSAPCIFSADVLMPSDLVGQAITFVLEWEDANSAGHRLMSVPVKVTLEASSARRMQSVASWSQIKSDGHGPGPMAWSSMDSKCDQEPLKYSLSFGVVERSDINNVFMPNEAPAVGGHDIANMFHSGYHSLIQQSSGQELKDLFPKGFCGGGLCQGEMSGCKPEAIQPVHIKQVVFKLSRFMKIDRFFGHGSLAEELRRALAYGLAILPDAIKVGEESMEEREQAEVEKTTRTTTTTTETTTSTSRRFAAPLVVTNGASPPAELFKARATSEPALKSTSIVMPGAEDKVTTSTTTEAFHAGNAFEEAGADRRLSGHAPRETRTLVVTVTKPMLYNFDEHLIATLIQRGAFNLISDGREKELGPIEIEGFHLRDSPLTQNGATSPHTKVATPTRFHLASVFVGAGALSVMGLVGAVAFRFFRRPVYSALETSSDLA